MSDDEHRTCCDRAVDVVLGYACHDGLAVQEALAGLDADGWTEVHAVLSGLLRSAVSNVELSGERWHLGDLVRHADEVAAAAPAHYEFAVAEAMRAWARGDRSAVRARLRQDLQGAVHITAVAVAVLGSALWGRAGLLDVLKEFRETVTALTNDYPFGD
jgi:hypothetical protein